MQRPVQVGIALHQTLTGQRQADPQRVALAGAGLDTEITVHQLHQLARDDQPQAPAMACRCKKVMTVDRSIEQRIALIRFERTPAVLHGNAQARALGRSVDRGDQQHLTLVGLLEGILQQVEQGLAQASRISGHDLRQLRLDKADQLDLLLFGLGAEDAQTVFDQCVEIELDVIQLNLAGFQLGNVENLVDQIEQLVAGTMDRLDVVALLGRQRCAQQQFAHAQHAIHWRSQFMADLGQEIGLGLEFRAAHRRSGVLGAAVGLALPLTFEQGEAEQQPCQGREAEQAASQPAGVELIEAQQHGHEENHADVEQGRSGHHQARRLIALTPVIDRDEQGAARRRQHQRIDQPAVPRPLTEQDAGCQRQYQVEFDTQQPGDPGSPAVMEETQCVAEQRCTGGHRRQVGDQRLTVGQPGQPRRHDPEIGHGAGQQGAMQQTQPDMRVAERVGKAQQVVDHQQRQCTEQRTEQISRLAQADQTGFIDGLEPGHHRMAGLQADIGLARLPVIGKAEQICPVGQWPGAEGAQFPGRRMLLELAVTQQVEIQVLHARCKQPQPLRACQ